MKGEKGDKKRGDKLLDKLAYSIEFRKEVDRIRNELGVPSSGFSNMRKIYDWYSKHQSENIIKRTSQFLKQQALPQNEWWQQKVIEFIFTNGRFSFLPRTYPVGSFIEISNRELTSVDLRIFQGASQREIIEFIKKNWNIIKPPYRIGTGKIIQPERDQKVGQRIAEIFEKPRKEIGSKRIAKEILIKHRIEKEFGKSPDFEAIKMRAYRKRHFKR